MQQFNDLSNTQKTILVVLGGTLLLGIFIMMASGETDELFFVFMIAAALIITIIIVAMNKFKANQEETQPVSPTIYSPQEPKPIVIKEKSYHFITDAELKETGKGNIIGAFATVLTIIVWVLFYKFTPSSGNSLADSILYGSIIYPVNLAGIAAILSIFGYFGHDSSCMLISAAALASIFIYDQYSIIISILPIILLCITSSHFRHRFVLDVSDVEIIQPIQKEAE